MTDQSASMVIVAQLIAAWEARDVEAIAACFTENGVWHNMPYAPIAGRDAIKAATAGFLNGAAEVRFEVRYAAEVAPGVVMNERTDIFRRENEPEIRLAVTGVFETQGGMIREWRDYFDPAGMGAS